MVDHSCQIQAACEVLCVEVKYSLHLSLAFHSLHLPRSNAKVECRELNAKGECKEYLWREITGTWTPECLARADLIGWNQKGIPKRSSKM